MIFNLLAMNNNSIQFTSALKLQLYYKIHKQVSK